MITRTAQAASPVQRVQPHPALLIVFFGALATSPVSLAEAEDGELPCYAIHRTACPILVDGCLKEPVWQAVENVGPFSFPWPTAGRKEQTRARLLWDDSYLYAAFSCQDAHIAARFTHRDEPVYRDDCVEVFCAPNPQRPDAYFNFEMNARAMLLDQHHPRGRFSGLDREWNSRGVRIATHVRGTLNDDTDADRGWTLEVAIPWENFRRVAPQLPPRIGEVWRLNLNRCGGETNPQYSQWSPSVTRQPDFHRPGSFGRVVLSNELAGAMSACCIPIMTRWRCR